MELSEEQREFLEDTKVLVASGDINISAIKLYFLSQTGVGTSLEDEQIMLCYASQNDDYGNEDIVQRMKALEDGKPLNWDGEQA